jgi:hypothetical protein
MNRGWLIAGTIGALIPVLVGHARAAEKPAAERGRKALLGRPFNPAIWSLNAYTSAWEQWGNGLKEVPREYRQAFMDRYGLHLPPYANGIYPMGLREAQGLVGKGVTTDCLLCHGGSVAGRSYVGLGNSTLDIQALFEDLARADGRSGKLPFTFCNVRGTTEAASMAVFLLSLRSADLRLRTPAIDLDLHDNMCEKTPAWWLLKKKKTMYHTGSTDARSVRSLMQFLLASLNPPAAIKKEEETFKDIQAYLLTLEPPSYPFAIDRALARRGEGLFVKTCSRCHGTYGPNGAYPNKIVPLDVVGTDRKRFDGLSRRFFDYYNQSWFGQEKTSGRETPHRAREAAGYQAPPLDGVWATAPYFHNGSAPTVYHVLNSRARPTVFTRSFRTGKEDYDPVKLGWRIEALERGADRRLAAIERRKVYDTTLPGRSNTGHTFGDKLTHAERMAIIEYLKTL